MSVSSEVHVQGSPKDFPELWGFKGRMSTILACEREAQSPLRRGVRGPREGPGKFVVLHALCSILVHWKTPEAFEIIFLKSFLCVCKHT